LKDDASRVQRNELGIGGQIPEWSRRRLQQIRRCCNHQCVGQRHDSADGAIIGWLTIGLVVGGGPEPDGTRCVLVQNSIRCTKMRGRKADGVVKPRMVRYKRAGLRTAAVEMSERQQRLDREREKREPRYTSDV